MLSTQNDSAPVFDFTVPESNKEKEFQNYLKTLEQRKTLYFVNKIKDQKSKKMEYLPQDLYEEIVDQTFNRLYQGFIDLQAYEDNRDSILEINRFFSRQITVNVKQGQFDIYEDASRQMVVVDSPISGPYRYEWDDVHKFWRSTTNDHYLDGFLVKEFMGISEGYLIF